MLYWHHFVRGAVAVSTQKNAFVVVVVVVAVVCGHVRSNESQSTRPSPTCSYVPIILTSFPTMVV